MDYLQKIVINTLLYTLVGLCMYVVVIYCQEKEKEKCKETTTTEVTLIKQKEK